MPKDVQKEPKAMKEEKAPNVPKTSKPEKQPKKGKAKTVVVKSLWITLAVIGYALSFWFTLTTCLGGFGLLSSNNLDNSKLFGVLMLLGGCFFLAALVLQLCGKARLLSCIFALLGSTATLVIGGVLADINGGAINAQGYAFTETSTFWQAHVLPAFTLLFCIGLWVYFLIARKKADREFFMGVQADKQAQHAKHEAEKQLEKNSLAQEIREVEAAVRETEKGVDQP